MNPVSAASRNPFLAWIGGAPPPLVFRRRPFEHALGVLGREVLRNLRRLEREASWEAFNAWLLSSQHLVALRSFVYSAVRPRTAAVEAASKRAKAWVEALDRREAKLGSGSMRRRIVRWRNDPARTSNERDFLTQLLVDWKETRAFPRVLHSVRAIQRQEQRERRRAMPAVMLTEADVGELPRDVQRDVRAEALRFRRGRPAGVLRVNHPGFDEARANLSSEATRQRLWKAQQAMLPSAAAVSELLDARRREAHVLGFSSHSQRVMARHALPAPRTVQRALTTFGESLAPMVRQTLDARADQAQERWCLPTTPWNVPFIDERTPVRTRHLLPGNHETVFPEAETLLRMGRELLALGGWRIGRRTRDRGNRRHWVLHHADGRTAYLIIDASADSAADVYQEAGSVVSVRGGWNRDDAPLPVTMFLQIGRAYSRRGLSWDEVRILTHEFGHVLHGLAMPAGATMEWERMPNDFCELPSQLVEMMAYCPTAIARWASPRAKACHRSVAFWEQRLLFNSESPLTAQAETVQCLVDFMAHAGDAQFDLMATANDLHQRFGFDPLHEGERTPLGYLAWSDYGGAHYCYLLNRFLIASLLPKWRQGTPEEQHLVPAITGLFERVLSRAVHGADVAKAWKSWRGETLGRSARQGARRLARRLATYKA